ncbi:MAG: response regulator, partial [Proteobacteria bacterium]|nr:response regulator [Pseudomonadota bacterium]
AGIKPFSDFSSLQFGGTHDAVVYAVKSGKVDAGTVRTDTLERMHQENKINLYDFRIFNEHLGGIVHLPFLHSTRAYPEWPMSKVMHTPDALAEKVAIKLIEMPEDSKAAISAFYSGWTIPLNYQSVHDCLKFLKAEPYENLGKITFQDVLKKYWPMLILILILFVVMALAIGIFIRFNSRIRASSIILEAEIEGHKRTAQLLKVAKAEAENANKAKTDFLSNMSHEIRTPMNAIIGLSHLCLGTRLKFQQRDYIEKVHQSARLLLSIINDILDFSKIEAGKLELESIPFKLDDVLNNLSNMISIKAHEKGLEILFDIDPETPLQLIGDPLRFGQILLNITGNSVKFTASGEIVVHIKPVQINQDTVELEVRVTDTGVGMTSDQISRLFHSFSQADASTTRKFGGTGLGLAISKHLVQQMKGRIWVESTPGKGSSFYLNVVFGRTFQTEKILKPGLAIDLDQLKVLVVDDVASARKMFAATLSSFSFRVTCVDSGEAALATLENAPVEDPFRLVLMDYNMPGMNGIDTSRKIKESPQLASLITLIMVTAYGSDDVMRQAEDIGLEGFLTKPVTPSDLLDTIVGALGDKGGLHKIGKSADHWKIKTLEGIKGAHILVAEDNKINQRVAEDLLTQAGMRVTIANNGKEAVELAEHINFDAILMDIQMPEMNGYEATQIICRNTLKVQPPIIAMTANAMSGDREKCLAAGMCDHVAKPIEPKNLFETLVKWIPEGKRDPVLVTIPEKEDLPKKTVLPHDLDGIDIETGLRRTGENRALYIELLKDFVTDHGNDNQVISQALLENNIELALRTAHTIKGVAGGIGALALYESAQKVETAIKENQLQLLEPLMEKMTRDLREVVEDLQRKITQQPSIDIKNKNDQPINIEKMISLLDEFQGLAEEMDPDAEEKAKEINQLLHLHGSIHKDLGTRLSDQSADMDFQEALETLSELRKAFGNISP